MNNNTTKKSDSVSNGSAWSCMVSVDDTALAVSDTGGSGRPVIYLNGSYATRRSWRPVISELGTGWRHITFDERSRGKSKKSADYSFEACLRDIDAVTAARGVQQPLLVGWSYGAALALHWATRHPDKVAGVVMVDGGYPWDYLATVDPTGDREAGRQEIRRLFRKMRVPLTIAGALGLAARMSVEQAAEVNIELNEIVAVSDAVFDRVTFPMRYVVGSGGAQGATEEGHAAMRATLDPILARNPNIQLSAKVASNHTGIVRKDFRAIATAVREVATASRNTNQ